MSFRTILSLVLVAALAIFALQNTAVLRVGFLFWSFQISQALLIALCGVAGVLVGFFLKLKRKSK